MNKKVKGILLSISLFLLSFSFVAAANYDQMTYGFYNGAYGYGGTGLIQSTAGLSNTSVPVIIGNAVRIILGLSGTVALVLVVVGGVQWMLSKGDETKIKDARKLMTSGAVGIIIIAAAYAIADFVIKQLSSAI